MQLLRYFILFICVGTVLSQTCDPNVRTFDGSCNNLQNPTWGSAKTLMIRGNEGVEYADGIAEPIRSPIRPNERVLSNNLFRSGGVIVEEPSGLNQFWTFFGQLISHDIGLNERNESTDAVFATPDNDVDAVIIPIIEPDDSLPPTVFVPSRKFRIRTLRSIGEIVNGQLEVYTDAASFLDLGPVYGLDSVRANAIRSFVGGKLKTRDYVNVTSVVSGVTTNTSLTNWLPLIIDTGVNNSRVVDLNQPDNKCFSAGDPRVDENIALATIHGMFLREHNMRCDELAAQHPDWTDEQIYQKARSIITGIYQHIVFDEYLPTLLGPSSRPHKHYGGYHSSVNPSASVVFTSAAFRFGHSTLPNVLEMRDQCNQLPYNGSQAFRNTRGSAGQNGGPTSGYDLMVWTGSPENVLHGILFNHAEKVDSLFQDALRNIRAVPFDVIAVNIMRGRLNGIPNYHVVREVYTGKSIYGNRRCPGANETSPSPDPIECFNMITPNQTLAEKLQLYYGKINNIDAYVGMLCEESVKKSAVGPTAAAIIADQFERLRDGDRFWYENEDNGLLTRDEIRFIQRETSAQYLLQRAFPTMHVPENAFFVPDQYFFDDC